MDTRPVDLGAKVATDWKVVYGDRGQLAAYFNDQAKALQFAAHHHGILIALAPV